MAVEGGRKLLGRLMPSWTAKLQEQPDTSKVCKPCTVCKATMKAKEEWLVVFLAFHPGAYF